MPTAGWYDDPDNSTILRWWDGNGWTDHVQPQTPDIVESPDDQSRFGESNFSENNGFLNNTDDVPPWMANNQSSDPLFVDGDEFVGYDEDDEEYDEDEDEDDESSPDSFDTARKPFANLGQPSTNPAGNFNLPEAQTSPPWMQDETDAREERSGNLFSGEATGRFGAPVGPSAGIGGSPDQAPNRESFSQGSQEVPPWIRDNDGPANRPVPPWGKEEQGRENAGPVQGSDPDDFYLDEDDDETVDGGGFMRPTSWEEMSRGGLYEDDDDGDQYSEPNEREEKIKRFVFIGAGVAGSLLIVYMLFSFFFGADGSGSSSSSVVGDDNVVVAEIGGWSDWPDPETSYLIKFPTDPSVVSTTEGRKTLTSNFNNENFRVLVRGIDPLYWDGLPPGERLVFINSYLTEEFPGIQALLPVDQWVEATLGGRIGRKMVFRLEGNVYAVTTTFINNRIYIAMAPLSVDEGSEESPSELLTKDSGNSKKFVDSWRWLPTPTPPAEEEAGATEE